MWKFEIIDSWERGLELAAKAHESVSESHVFSNPVLLKAWIKTYQPLRRLEPVFISGSNDDGSYVSLPLVLWKRNWKNAFLHTLLPIGHSDFDYHDPLFWGKPLSHVSKRLFWSELIEFLTVNVKFDTLSLEGMTDKAISDSLQWQKNEICPSLELASFKSETDIFSFLKTSLRGDIRRQMRRLGEIGELHMKEFRSWNEITPSTFQTFMHHHALRWPNAYKAPKFHENLLRDGLESGIVHFSTLMVGDKEVAWHLGFEENGRYYYYMPAGNADYLKFSPVKVHLFLLVKRAVEKGLLVFDHLRGEENYKDGWSNGSQYVNVLAIKSGVLMSKFRFNMLKMRLLITPPMR